MPGNPQPTSPGSRQIRASPSADRAVRLEQLREELVAEGADPSKRLPELQRRADTWPE